MAMIQQAESPQVGDTALGSQNMALEVSRHIGHIRAGRRGCWRLFRQSRGVYLVVLEKNNKPGLSALVKYCA